LILFRAPQGVKGIARGLAPGGKRQGVASREAFSLEESAPNGRQPNASAEEGQP